MSRAKRIRKNRMRSRSRRRLLTAAVAIVRLECEKALLRNELAVLRMNRVFVGSDATLARIDKNERVITAAEQALLFKNGGAISV